MTISQLVSYNDASPYELPIDIWEPFRKWFPTALLKSCENSWGSNFNSNSPIMPRFCTCYDSWAVMPCAKLWHDWIFSFSYKSNTQTFIRFGLWAHELIVKRAPSILMINHSSDIKLTVAQSCLAINSSPPRATYVCQWTGSALVQIMACHLFGTKPLSKPKLSICQLDTYEQTSVKF